MPEQLLELKVSFRGNTFGNAITNMISKMCDFDEKAYLDMYRSPSYSYTVCVQLSLVFETHYYIQFHI